jgi:hypothetical protein
VSYRGKCEARRRSKIASWRPWSLFKFTVGRGAHDWAMRKAFADPVNNPLAAALHAEMLAMQASTMRSLGVHLWGPNTVGESIAAIQAEINSITERIRANHVRLGDVWAK